MAKDTQPRTRRTITEGAGACPVHGSAPCPPAASAAQPRGPRRRTRRWTLMLFVVEVAVVVALVWFSWSGGAWS